MQGKGLGPADPTNVKKSREQKTKEGTKTESKKREPHQRSHKLENTNLDSKINKRWQPIIYTRNNTNRE